MKTIYAASPDDWQLFTEHKMYEPAFYSTVVQDWGSNYLIAAELVDIELTQTDNFKPAYMLDQSHNVTDPIESLMTSAIEVQRAFVQASLIDLANACPSEMFS